MTTLAPLAAAQRDAADRAEFAAYAETWAATPPAAASALGLFSATTGPYTALGCRGAAGVPMLNRITGVGLGDLDTAALAAAVSLLHEAGCVAQVSLRDDAPGAPEARAWLEARGFADGYAWMRFALPPGLDAPEPREGAVRTRVCSPADAAVFGGTFATGYELPPPFAEMAGGLVGRPGWTCVLAETVDGVPAGAGAMHVRDGVAWLGLGATVPALRGRGVQPAVLGARIREARRLGCGLVVTETGELEDGRPSASYRNILRAGFVEVGRRPNLVASPPG